MVSEVRAEAISPLLGMAHDFGPHTIPVLTWSRSLQDPFLRMFLQCCDDHVSSHMIAFFSVFAAICRELQGLGAAVLNLPNALSL